MRCNRSRRKYLRWVETVLLAAGVVSLGGYALVTLQATVWQSYQNWILGKAMRGERASMQGFLTQEFHATEAHREPDRVPAERPRTEGALVGRVEIPRIQLSAMVLEGTSGATLRVAAGHIAGTALPGEPGNAGIAAHRDTFFRGLSQVRAADRIVVVTPTGSYSYRVRSISIVAPQETSVLAPLEHDTLTLVTCYPFYYVGHAPKRFVVRADRITGTQASARELPTASDVRRDRL
jgi:sortase A